MPTLRRALGAAALVSCSLLLAASASAQTVIKFPGGPDVRSTGPGQFSVLVGGVIRWSVVLDNTFNPQDIQFNYLDWMDPAGVIACGADPPCLGAEHLELLCDAPNAPDPDGGVVFDCDPALGRLDLRNIPVAAGASSCVQFSTRVRPSGRLAGQVANQGCVDVTFPLPSTTLTRPTNDALPACTPVPGSALTTDCSRVFVPNIEPPSFTGLKTATVEDVNANGETDVGDVITWTVVMTNNGAEEHDGWAYDPIPAGTTFLDIVDNPDGLCTFTGTEIDCPALHFLGGETKTLRFRTTLACTSVTDDDTYSACNTAFMCTDPTRIACGPSDNDTTVPPNPTCVDVAEPDFTAATKTWAFDDLDADGALSAGDRVRFSIQVRNDGTGTAFQTRVEDVLDTTCFDEASLDPGNAVYDAGTRTLTWTQGDMAPGASENLLFSAVVLTDAGPCCNQASIQHVLRDTCALSPIVTDDPTTPAADDASCLRFGPQPVIELRKDFDVTDDVAGNGTIDAGDEVTFTITVRNLGAGVATNVTLDDLILPCWEGFAVANIVATGEGTNESTELTPPMTPNRVRFTSVGGADGLAPLGAETFTVSFPVRVATLGQCCNQANVTLDESPVPVESNDPTTPLRDDPTCTSRTAPQARFEIAKVFAEADGDGCVERGEDVTFSITVTARDADARLVQLDDVISDPGLVFDVVDSGSGSYDSGTDTITWALPDIAQDETRTITWIGRFACSAADGQTSSDTATVSAFNGAPSSADATVTLSAPELTLTKAFTFDDTDASGALSAGDTAIFTITVENTGSCQADQVVLTDSLDHDLDHAAVTADGTPLNDGAGNLQWDATTTPPLASLAPAASQVLTVRVPVLDPATNPDPARDGIVDNVVHAAASAPPSCPIDVPASSATQVINVVNAFLDVKLVALDADADGCFEAGEVITFLLDALPVGGSAADVVLTCTLDDTAAVLAITDDGGATVDAGPPVTLTWNLGTLAADVLETRTWQARVRCDVPDATRFGARADGTSSNLPPDAASLEVFASAPVLTATKTLEWTDDGDGAVEAGELVKYVITLQNAGSCGIRRIEVSDLVDPDLDRSQIVASAVASNDGAGLITWDSLANPAELEDVLPGETVVLTLETPALDPTTNPDPLADGVVPNDALAVVNSEFDCLPVAVTASAPTFTINVTFGVSRLLRSDFITCRADAMATMRQFLRERPAPQECSEPPAIDPLHRGTQVLDAAASPTFLFSDADPAASFERCPQSAAGFGRILVFYELDEPPPACVTTLRVRKVGNDIEVTW